MTSVDSPLLWVKVLGLVGAGGLFAWWQFRDLAQARKEREREARLLADTVDDKNPRD